MLIMASRHLLNLGVKMHSRLHLRELQSQKFSQGACARNSIILIYFAINQKYNNSIQKYTKDNTEYSN